MSPSRTGMKFVTASILTLAAVASLTLPVLAQTGNPPAHGEGTRTMGFPKRWHPYAGALVDWNRQPDTGGPAVPHVGDTSGDQQGCAGQSSEMSLLSHTDPDECGTFEGPRNRSPPIIEGERNGDCRECHGQRDERLDQ